jgi:hypothetical protein
VTSSRVSWLVLAAAFLFLVSAVGLPAQEPTARVPVSTPVITGAPAPDAANGVENMYVPPTPHAPFSAKSVASLTRTLRDGSTSYFAFFSLLARDSSGRIYFENRRPMPTSGDPEPRTYFIMIDPGERTRTICYVATKTCRINSFRRSTYAESQSRDEAPPASSTESVSLGTDVIEALTVTGTREITTIAMGAYGNHRPIITTKEVWHSPELDLDVSTTRADPRNGTQTRRITEISRTEPDAQYFSIPADYEMLDNRVHAKQEPRAN